MGSLQDALLKTGLANEEQARKKRSPSAKGKPAGKNAPRKGKGKPPRGPNADGRGPGNDNKGGDRRRSKPSGKPQSDLERAYAARKRAEKAEKEREKQARVADQEERRKRNLKLDGIVEGKALNVEDAELPRYFEHIGRIRRVLCTREQREQINNGELGVVSLRGRYIIVSPEVLAAYRELAPDLVPDLTGKEPEAPDDDYPPVPDDLTW